MLINFPTQQQPQLNYFKHPMNRVWKQSLLLNTIWGGKDEY